MNVRCLGRLLLVGSAFALVSACADGAGPAATADPVDDSRGITITAAGMKYDIERVEVQSGTTATISFENQDATAHTLTVHAGASADSPITADTGDVAGAETGEAVVFFSTPGEHLYVCKIHPDTMHGTLVVSP